jgi:hypothetical protein
VRAAFYNEKLYLDGQGLFPARLGGVADLLVDEIAFAMSTNGGLNWSKPITQKNQCRFRSLNLRYGIGHPGRTSGPLWA